MKKINHTLLIKTYIFYIIAQYLQFYGCNAKLLQLYKLYNSILILIESRDNDNKVNT